MKVSDAVNEPSLAVTLKSRLPVWFSGGVPEKVPVVASNVTQDGSAVPSDIVAV